jgi:hypothetical protein
VSAFELMRPPFSHQEYQEKKETRGFEKGDPVFVYSDNTRDAVAGMGV